MGSFVWPSKCTSISSVYGNRLHPIQKVWKFHDGIDISASYGTEIYAAGSGTVYTQDFGAKVGYGKYIQIDHGNGFITFYGHCSKWCASSGQTVKAGQKIAEVGSTGWSTGPHLHFGMKKNGSSVNPLNYVSASDGGNYSDSSSGGGTTVDAMFTAYFPFNDAMEGGYYDAMGNLLDTSKRTCAAPASLPFGTTVTVQGTGTSKDGQTYTVNDRGGAINIVNGVYHFDLLMSTREECNTWGVKYGKAVINGDGSEVGTAESSSKEITTVVVKSVSGTAGDHKESLTSTAAQLSGGAEILIQNDQIYMPYVEEGIKLERVRKDGPSKLTFSVLKDSVLNFQEGNPVSFRYNGKNVFLGYVFSKSRSDNHTIKVTCYDQIRYLKNKDTISYEDKTYAELLRMIAADYGLKCGEIEDTGYKIESRIEETTLLDVLGNASDMTILNTGKLYVLYDDYGKLSLKNIASMKTNVVIEDSSAEGFDYASTIDSDTYNRIKLAYDNGDTGEREVYVYNSEANQSLWGTLQYYSKLDSAPGEELLSAKAAALMSYYNTKHRTLKLKGCAGNTDIRGGSLVAVVLALGDINVSNYMCVESVTHTFSNGSHTMDLTLSGTKGVFVT